MGNTVSFDGFKVCQNNLCDIINGYIINSGAELQVLQDLGRPNNFAGNTTIDENGNPIFMRTSPTPFETFYIVKVKNIYSAVCKYTAECETKCNNTPLLNFLNIPIEGLKFEIDFGSKLFNCIPNLYLQNISYIWCQKINKTSKQCEIESDCDKKCNKKRMPKWEKLYLSGISNPFGCFDVEVFGSGCPKACKERYPYPTDNPSQIEKLIFDTNKFFDFSNLNEIRNNLNPLTVKPKFTCVTSNFYAFKYPIRIGDLLLMYRNCPNPVYRVLLDESTFNLYQTIRNNECPNVG